MKTEQYVTELISSAHAQWRETGAIVGWWFASWEALVATGGSGAGAP